MKFGLQHPSFTYDGKGTALSSTLLERARIAEEKGFDSFWVMDHLIQIPYVGAPQEPMLESWSTISFIAGATSKIKVGSLVTGNIYRSPALVAKASSTLDVLSGGRLFMGIGAGWFEEESAAYGIPHFTKGERLRRLDEAAQIILGMWTKDRFSFQGRYYLVHDAYCNPKPLQRPHPPLMIGGSGEKVTLKIVARHADACNLFGGPKTVLHKLQMLKDHCQAVGRDYRSILKTTLGSVIIANDQSEVNRLIEAKMGPSFTPAQAEERGIFGTPDAVAARIGEYIKAGAEYMIFSLDAGREGEMLKLLADEVLPQFS